MPPKKEKSSKKGKKTVKEQTETKVESVYKDFAKPDIEKLRAHQSAEDYIIVELINEQWKFASFSVVVRTNTPLYTIRRFIKERHAHCEGLRLYRSKPDENKNNELIDFSLTLSDLSFFGGPREANFVESLYYELGPIRCDPIVQREPGLLLIPDLSSRGLRQIDETHPTGSSSALLEPYPRYFKKATDGRDTYTAPDRYTTTTAAGTNAMLANIGIKYATLNTPADMSRLDPIAGGAEGEHGGLGGGLVAALSGVGDGRNGTGSMGFYSALGDSSSYLHPYSSSISSYSSFSSSRGLSGLP